MIAGRLFSRQVLPLLHVYFLGFSTLFVVAYRHVPYSYSMFHTTLTFDVVLSINKCIFL